MVLLILTDNNSFESIKTIIRRSSFVLLPLSVVLIKYFRTLGIAYTEDGLRTMWTGVTTQKNDLGALALVCGIYFASNIVTGWKSRRKILLDSLLLTLALWLLVGSSSVTSQISFAVSVSILLTFHLLARDSREFQKYRIAIGGMLLFIVVTTFYGPFVESAAETLSRDQTLTGRTDIWKAVLEAGARNPLFGRGYGSFWIGNLANDVWSSDKIYTHIQQSHNGYIDIYIELGGLGLALFACLIWSVNNKIKRAVENDVEYGAFRLSIFAMVLIHNLTESSFARPTQLLWFLFLLVCMDAAAEGR